MTILPPTLYDMDFLDTILTARANIAEVRRMGLHLIANIQRDEMVCRLEAWIDPEGVATEKARTDQAGKRAARAALLIDEETGF